MQIDKNDSNASQKKAGILQTSSVSKELQPLQPLTPTPANGGTYKARRYALKLDPPCICMEYGDLEGKSRVRAVGHFIPMCMDPTSGSTCLHGISITTPCLHVPCLQVRISKITPDMDVDRLTRKVGEFLAHEARRCALNDPASSHTPR